MANVSLLRPYTPISHRGNQKSRMSSSLVFHADSGRVLERRAGSRHRNRIAGRIEGDVQMLTLARCRDDGALSAPRASQNARPCTRPSRRNRCPGTGRSEDTPTADTDSENSGRVRSSVVSRTRPKFFSVREIARNDMNDDFRFAVASRSLRPASSHGTSADGEATMFTLGEEKMALASVLSDESGASSRVNLVELENERLHGIGAEGVVLTGTPCERCRMQAGRSPPWTSAPTRRRHPKLR